MPIWPIIDCDIYHSSCDIFHEPGCDLFHSWCDLFHNAYLWFISRAPDYVIYFTNCRHCDLFHSRVWFISRPRTLWFVSQTRLWFFSRPLERMCYLLESEHMFCLCHITICLYVYTLIVPRGMLEMAHETDYGAGGPCLRNFKFDDCKANRCVLSVIP